MALPRVPDRPCGEVQQPQPALLNSPDSTDASWVPEHPVPGCLAASCLSWLSSGCAQVVYLTEVIDEPVFNHLEKYDGHALVDVAREGLDLGETEDDKQQACLLAYWLDDSIALAPACGSH